MADRTYQSGESTTIPIIVTDDAGNPATMTPGTTFTAASDRPASLDVQVVLDVVTLKPTVVITPLVQNSTGISVTVAPATAVNVSVFPVAVVPSLKRPVAVMTCAALVCDVNTTMMPFAPSDGAANVIAAAVALLML